MSTTKVYIIDTKDVPEWLPLSLVFWPNYRFEIPEKRLFLKEIMAPYTKPFLDIVSDIEEADFIAVPVDYFFVLEHAPEYLARVYTFAKELGKKVLLFDYTDYVDRVPKLPAHAVLFRVSVYRHHKQPSEIVMPYFVEDLGTNYAITPKERGSSLIVGYCGQARFGSIAKKWKAVAKRIAQSILLRLRRDVRPAVHIRGIFWRNQVIRALRKGGTECRIIERAFYSLHQSGVVADPKDIRRDYVENLKECDLALCVRGDANASQRFFEALSASRIPLLLDTDVVLPLEGVVSYTDCVVRIPFDDIKCISRHVDVWSSTHESSVFVEMEQKARKTYESFLRLDQYFDLVFDRERSPYKTILYDA